MKKPPGEGGLTGWCGAAWNAEMAAYEIDDELERALDRWIEQLREPPATRGEAVTLALRDFLMGQGVIPYDEEPDEPDSTSD